MHDDLSLVSLVPISMVLGRAYYLSRPPGCQITMRDRVLFGLAMFALCGVWIGAKVIFAVKFAPEVTFFGRLARGVTVVGIGLVPLLIVKLVGWGRHVKRRVRNPRQDTQAHR